MRMASSGAEQRAAGWATRGLNRGERWEHDRGMETRPREVSRQQAVSSYDLAQLRVGRMENRER